MDNNTPSVRKVPLQWGMNGDQEIVSSDTSFFREGSGWNAQLVDGTDMYTLCGNQIIMKYWSHNAPVDPMCNFIGRDDSGISVFWAYCEDETTRYFSAPAGLKGTVPIFALTAIYNNFTGAWTYGQIANALIQVYNPANFGTLDPTGTTQTGNNAAFTACVAAINAANTRAMMVIPIGVYIVNTGIMVFTTTNPIAVIGADRGICVLIPGSGTGDMVKFASGAGGCTAEGFSIYQTGTPQTAGAGINTNGANDVRIEKLQFVNLFNDVYVNGSSIKVNITHCVQSQTNGSSTSVGILVNNGLAGDTYIGPDIVHSNTGATRRRACVEVVTTGHFEINQCNMTGAAQGLLIDPGAAQTVSFGFINTSLFDSCTVNGVTVNAASSTSIIQSVSFNDSWFSGTIVTTGGAGVVTTGTAGGILNGLHFVGCRFYNNQTHGFQHGFGTGVEFHDCHMKGNSQAGSATADALNIAAGVSNWRVIGGKYGGTVDTVAASLQRYGINVLAGASNSALILGCECTGNVTGPISNNSTGTITVRDVVGMVQVPGATTPATLLAATTTYVTPAVAVPLGAFQVGQKYRFLLNLTNVATASTTTVIAKLGTAGTTADGNIFSQALGAGTAVADTAQITITLTVKTLSATVGAIYWSMEVRHNTNTTTGFMNVAYALFSGTVATLNTLTASNFMGIALTASIASATTVQETSLEVVGGRG